MILDNPMILFWKKIAYNMTDLIGQFLYSSPTVFEQGALQECSSIHDILTL